MEDSTPRIKIKNKESERPIVKIDSLPVKKSSNFIIEDDNSSVDHHVAECSGDSVDKIVAEWMLMLTEIVFSPGAQRRSNLLQQLCVLKGCIQVINSIKQEKFYNLEILGVRHTNMYGCVTMRI